MTRPISPLTCPEFLPTLSVFEIEERVWEKIQVRKEDEAILRSAKKCAELGIDQERSIVNYLRKFGSFITPDSTTQEPHNH